MEPTTIRVVTGLKEADATFEHATATRDVAGVLVIQQRGGLDLAWYGAGQWVKVEFNR